ncbi:MAG: indolepyruvate oxidoreductase subunit beta family protein [Burkholderiales bacterium]
MADTNTHRPITLLICALGGEGGGVLVEWLVRTATTCGFAAQSTSIPGVAQRTGSTTYYIEIFPVPLSELGDRRPVFSLYPVAGALDILVSSELLETVRQISNGMVCAERTHVLTSTSRTFTTAEKMQLADGRIDGQELLEVIRGYSRSCHAMDMSALARDAGTVVSAVLMGVIAGSGLLPFPREAFESTIGQSARGVDASLRGFAQAFERVQKTTGEQPPSQGTVSQATAPLAELPQSIRDDFPKTLHDMLALGYARCLEYQDAGYARLFTDRLKQILEAERLADAAGRHGFAATREAARYLALWMAFDDIVRVADLKSRASRFDRIRGEVKAGPDELLRVHDYFKPGVPEIAGLLPGPLAHRLLRYDTRRLSAGKAPIAFSLKLAASSVTGFAALRILASLRWLRKRSLRYWQEQDMIGRWLDGIRAGFQSDWQTGFEVACCAHLIKGYGSTNERGKANLMHVLDHLLSAEYESASARASAIRAAREAAQTDDTGKALDNTLAQLGAPAREVKGQPVVWMKKPQRTGTRA